MPVAILPIETPRYQASDGFVPRRLVSPEPMASGGGDEEEYMEFEDPRLVFTDDAAPEAELLRLNTLRRERESCDVVLFVREREIVAHRRVLAAFSPTLAELMAQALAAQQDAGITMDGLDEGSRPLLYLEFPSLNYDAFAAILDYAYTNRLEITSSLVGEVYKAASYLGVASAAAAASGWLAQNLSAANAIGVRRSANRAVDAQLAGTVDAYINRHFPDIITHSHEFTGLPTVQVEVIVEGGSVEERPAELVARVLAWFQALPLPENREFRIEYLTQASHMLYLDGSGALRDARDIEGSLGVSNSDLVVDYKAKKKTETGSKTGSAVLISPQLPNASLLSTPHLHGRSKSGSSTKASPPSPEGVPMIGSTPLNLLSMTSRAGLSSSESLSSMGSSLGALSSEPDEIHWQAIAVARVAENFVIALAVMHQRLVALSVRVIDSAKRPLRGSEDVNTTLSGESSPVRSPASPTAFHIGAPPNQPPANLPNLAAPRCSNALVALGDRLVAAGGYDRGECLSSAEACRLSPDGAFGPWEALPAMKEERGRFDAVGAEGKLWAIGGSSGLKDLSSVEAFDPVSESWSPAPSMLFPKSNHGAAALEGKVYCVGGWNGQVGVREVEVLDVRKEGGAWELAPALTAGRYQAGCTGVRGLGVVAVGGCEHWGVLATVEVLKEGAAEWRRLPDLIQARRGCGVTEWKGKLWAVGGSDGVRSLTSTEVLDLSAVERGWVPGPSLSSPRANVRAAVIHGRLVAVGGFSGKTFLATMEFLDEETGDWSTHNPAPAVE